MMSYLVMECHPGYAVLLDEEGRFWRAANFGYAVGQKVYNPVFMKEKEAKKRHTVRWICGGIAALAACFLLIFGVSNYREYMRPYSSIYLSINPEVKMELNRQGIVVGLSGTNEDGKKLLEGYEGNGKDKVTVADELIDRAIQQGFLSEGGLVSILIDAPDDTLFQAYGVELRTGVTQHLDGRMAVDVEIVNYRDRQEDTPVFSQTTQAASPETEEPTVPETPAPTTAAPETTAPTTAAPETPAPTTAAPETTAPTTAAPETAPPTTTAPTTAAPETTPPTTAAPTTAAAPETTMAADNDRGNSDYDDENDDMDDDSDDDDEDSDDNDDD